MAAYQTLDYLPDLTSSEMLNATALTWKTYTPTDTVSWDSYAEAYGSDRYALLHSTYRINAIEGATYDIFSTSYFDPFLLRIYDANGNVIVANDEADDGLDILLGGANYSSDVLWDLVAPYTGTYYIEASWNQGSYYTFYSLFAYEDIDTARALTNSINGASFRDWLVATSSNDVINGGADLDTVTYAGNRSNYDIVKNPTGFTVTDTTGASGTDTITNVERIVFQDKAVALDTSGTGGQAYRLYQAAFNRTPDSAGVGWQMKALDNGASLVQIASNFMGSAEFTSLYGAAPSTDTLVNLLYNNVLHRTPQQFETDFWVNIIATGQQSRAEVLTNFSESPENQAQVIGSIQNGFEYTYFA